MNDDFSGRITNSPEKSDFSGKAEWVVLIVLVLLVIDLSNASQALRNALHDGRRLSHREASGFVRRPLDSFSGGDGRIRTAE